MNTILSTLYSYTTITIYTLYNISISILDKQVIIVDKNNIAIF